MSDDLTKNGPVEVTVNNKKVKVHSPATGLEIKQAAIDAGVPIQLDFRLELKQGDETDPIGDDQKIILKEGARFTAVTDDDNS